MDSLFIPCNFFYLSQTQNNFLTKITTPDNPGVNDHKQPIFVMALQWKGMKREKCLLHKIKLTFTSKGKATWNC